MSTDTALISTNDSSWLERNLSLILLAVLAVAAIAITAVLSVYASNFASRTLSPGTDAWGQFGDYIGGTLNPLLSFLALIALLITLWIQARSLGTARQQIAHQSEVAALSAQISAITALVSSLNDQIEQDNTFTSKGGFDHLEGNRQRLNRRDVLLRRLDALYEQLSRAAG